MILCLESEFNERVQSSRVSIFEVFEADGGSYFTPQNGKFLCLLPQFVRGAANESLNYSIDDLEFISQHFRQSILPKISQSNLNEFYAFLHDRLRSVKQITGILSRNPKYSLRYCKGYLPLFRLFVSVACMLVGQEAAGFDSTLAMKTMVDQAVSLKSSILLSLTDGAERTHTDLPFLLSSMVEMDMCLAVLTLNPFDYPIRGAYTPNSPGCTNLSGMHAHIAQAVKNVTAVAARLSASTAGCPLAGDTLAAPLHFLETLCAALAQGNWWRAIRTVTQLQRALATRLSRTCEASAHASFPSALPASCGAMATTLLSACVPHWRAVLLTLRNAYAMPKSTHSMAELAAMLALPCANADIDSSVDAHSHEVSSASLAPSVRASWPKFLDPTHVLMTLCRAWRIPVQNEEHMVQILDQSEERGLSWMQLVEQCQVTSKITEVSVSVKACMKVNILFHITEADFMAYGKYMRLSSAYYWRSLKLKSDQSICAILQCLSEDKI